MIHTARKQQKRSPPSIFKSPIKVFDREMEGGRDGGGDETYSVPVSMTRSGSHPKERPLQEGHEDCTAGLLEADDDGHERSHHHDPALCPHHQVLKYSTVQYSTVRCTVV